MTPSPDRRLTLLGHCYILGTLVLFVAALISVMAP